MPSADLLTSVPIYLVYFCIYTSECLYALKPTISMNFMSNDLNSFNVVNIFFQTFHSKLLQLSTIFSGATAIDMANDFLRRLWWFPQASDNLRTLLEEAGWGSKSVKFQESPMLNKPNDQLSTLFKHSRATCHTPWAWDCTSLYINRNISRGIMDYCWTCSYSDTLIRYRIKQ